jgi:membrane-bound serine protease (ClpP class)
MRTIAMLLFCWVSAASAQPGGPVVVLTQSGAIGPANADYLHRGIEHAAKLGAQLIVLRMDTPGGLDLSMRSIIRDILASPVPVATYVAPTGARAASAGTYILYASHIAAMAPATNLGAATPVDLGRGDDARDLKPDGKPGNKADDAKKPPSTEQTMMRKQINDSAAYIRGLAQLRGRNADWAERAVREAVSLSAREALKLKVIDMMADDLPQLLKQLDGRTVSAAGGQAVLSTLTAEIVQRDPDWRTELLAVITNPAIAYMLLLIGIYGLLFEFMNPGFAIPGVVGGICLLLALFALHLLPVSYAGLALIGLGGALFMTEFFTGFSGVLGAGGIVAFVVGSIMLIDTDMPAYAVPPSLVVVAAVFGAAALLVVVRLAFAVRRRPVVSGREQLIGSTGLVLSDGDEPYARVQGERWKVRSTGALQPGNRVRVIRIDGLVLEVEMLEGAPDR